MRAARPALALGLLLVSGGAAAGSPLLRVRGRDVAVDVSIKKGFVDARFGFRTKASAAALWAVVSNFKRGPELVDGMEPLKVKRKGKDKYDLVIRGALLWEYGFRVRARTAFRKGHGSIRWTILGTKPASGGEMRVDPVGKKEAIFSFSTRVKNETALPDFLVATVLRVAIKAAGKAVRKALESK